MSLLFIDGFDHWATGEALKKWSNVGGTVNTASTVPRRTGSRHASLVASSTPPSLTHYCAASEDTIVVGLALYATVRNNHYGFRLVRAGEYQCSVVIEDDGSVTVRRGDYNGTIIDQSDAGDVPTDTWVYFEFKIYVHDSSGTYEVRINENTVLSGDTVDTKGGSTAGVDTVNLRAESSGGGWYYWDDLYIDDDDFLGDCRVDCLWPDGDGNYSQWTPDPSGNDNYENVDDSTDIDDDTTYNVTGVLNEIDTYTFDDLEAVSGATIFGVAVNMVVRKDDAGAREVTPLIRMSSTDYAGTEVPCYDNYRGKQEIWENPPDDPSDEWADADVNGMEAGVKLTT
jgi:hypothetical protein